MKERTLMITGSSGLVGSYFRRLTALTRYRIYNLIHLEQTNFGKSIYFDLSNSVNLFRQVIDEIKPDIILHLAAMTDVEQCEIERNLANNINHLSVRELANYIANNNECFLLHVSTDYVFDGEKGDYNEAAKTNPINWYGMTKLLGEQELVNCKSENWCIARTSTPFGIHTKKLTFPLFVMNNLSERRELRVLVDQITSPTYALNLSEMLLEIIENRIIGVIHVSGSSHLSRFEQALEIASLCDLDKNLIKPVCLPQMEWKARRPKNSSLNTAKAYGSLRKKPMGFKESLLEFTTEL